MPRRTLDFYPTPSALTLALLDAVPEICTAGNMIYEPCAGDGAISKVLANAAQSGTQVHEADIDPRHPGMFMLDARTQFPGNKYDWVVTNPPFNCADEIWRNMTNHAPNVALLLRLSFLEPVHKREFLRVSPPHRLLVMPRTSFTDDGKTDSVTCAWMIWECGGPAHENIKVYNRVDLQRLVKRAASLAELGE